MVRNPFRRSSAPLPLSLLSSGRVLSLFVAFSLSLLLLYIRSVSQDVDPIHLESSSLRRGDIDQQGSSIIHSTGSEIIEHETAPAGPEPSFNDFTSSMSHAKMTPDTAKEKPATSHSDNSTRYATPTTSNNWNPSKSAVLGLAYGYGLWAYRDFVGSLRATGFLGHIILGISSDPYDDVLEYLKEQNVTIKYVHMAEKCTYNGTIGHDGRIIDTKGWHCARDYPDYKITWGRFKLYEDWLKEEVDVTDGVMLTDVRDAYFQRDPFEAAVEMNMQHPLMLFEEHPDMRNTHWLTDVPVSSCKNHRVGETQVLCSGSVMGSREGILDYIRVMVEEFDAWKTQQNCRFDMPGDDQSIHNYLYYTNRFKNATTIPHRTGPIQVLGYQADLIWKEADAEGKEKNITVWNIDNYYVKDDVWQNWLPSKHGLIDPKTGLILNLDGLPSPQVHQVDRFGSLNRQWLRMMNEQGWPYNKP